MACVEQEHHVVLEALNIRVKQVRFNHQQQIEKQFREEEIVAYGLIQ